MSNNLSAQEALTNARVGYAKVGLAIAVVAAMSWGFQGIVMGKAGSLWPFADDSYGVWVICIAALVTGALHDIFAGVWIALHNIVTGKGLREYGRLLRTRVGRLVIIGAVLGGPLATGFFLIGVNLSGATYSMAISGAYPIVGAVLSRFVFKEKLTRRSLLGVALAITGSFIVGYAPPEGMSEYFYIGLIFAGLAGLFWALEGVTVTYANDMADPAFSVGAVRTFISGLVYVVILIPVFCIIAKENITLGWQMMGQAFTSGSAIFWIALAAIGGGISYRSFYTAMNKTGCTRAMAINISFSLWSIVFGFLFQALGIIDYQITWQAIIGVVVIVSGTVIVVANPRELLQLRSTRTL